MSSARSAAAILAGLEPLGVRLELGPFRALLAELGSPELGLPAVLVAGTNGKGSTAALLDAIARAAGLRAGLYTSPHLERWHERIRIGGAEIGEAELAATLERVVETAAAAGLEPPTPFEAMTAAAFLAFREARVELAVLEVGLGGRLDATNAVAPILSVVTRVALDHRELLGETLDAIAREKAGILRPGVPALVAPQEPEAEAALVEAAARLDAPFELVARSVSIEASEWRGLAGHRLRLRTPEARHELELPLAGDHQRINAATAVRAAERLAQRFPALTTAAIAAGVAAVRWPGRLERLASRRPGVDLLLDAAHNPDGCAALAGFLARLDRRYVLLFGALADKQVEAMLPPLADGAAAVVLTRPDSPRALAPARLLVVAGPAAEAIDEPAAALARALGRAGELGATLVVAAGSIYLVGRVRALAGGSPG